MVASTSLFDEVMVLSTAYHGFTAPTFQTYCMFTHSRYYYKYVASFPSHAYHFKYIFFTVVVEPPLSEFEANSLLVQWQHQLPYRSRSDGANQKWLHQLRPLLMNSDSFLILIANYTSNFNHHITTCMNTIHRCMGKIL